MGEGDGDTADGGDDSERENDVLGHVNLLLRFFCAT